MSLYSDVAKKMNSLTGVREIMSDIAIAVQRGNDVLNLGAGNPIIIPEFSELWKDCNDRINYSEYSQIVGKYGSSKGYAPLIDTFCQLLNDSNGWNISAKNCLISPGSQSLYFMLLNIFSGKTGNTHNKICIPCAPEYTGYNGVTLNESSIHSVKPLIKSVSKSEFKYSIDFDTVEEGIDEFNCLLTSRPNNPSGLVTTNKDMERLISISNNSNIPLIIDSAYSYPIPNLVNSPMKSIFSDNTIYCYSLSKSGLPGERIGIMIANPEIVNLVQSFQSNLFIHSSQYGQALANEAIKTGALNTLCLNLLQPIYRNKQKLIVELLESEFINIPWKIHSMEGALFAWINFEDLPISDLELYRLCKNSGLFIVPGSFFFFGLSDEEWQHQNQCIRISLTAGDHEIEKGIKILRLILEKVYL